MNNNYTLYSVPGPVSTLSSLMSTTWAVISWSVPSYIPVNYLIITYEIGYTSHQSNDSCSPSDEFSSSLETNTSSINVNISDLIGNSCYLFGVRGYTVNGYGLWTVIGNTTEQELTICTNEGNCRQSRNYYYITCMFTVTSSNISTITILSVLVGILLIVVIVSVVGNILQFIYNRRYEYLIMSISNYSLFDAGSVNQSLLPLKFNNKQTVGKLSYFCYLVLTHTLFIYRPDEDIEMKVCEPYIRRPSKIIDRFMKSVNHQ